MRAGDRERQAARRYPEKLPPQLPRILREALVRPRPRHGGNGDRRRGEHRPLRHRPRLRFTAHSSLQAVRRNLRGPVGREPALHHGRPGRRHGTGEPFRIQYRHRQVGRAPHALPRAKQPHRLGLYLFRRRARREHHRPCLGRPGHDLRAGRPDGGQRTLQPRARTLHRRYRLRADRERPDASPDFQRRCNRRGPPGGALPHHPLRPCTRTWRYWPRPPDPPLPLRPQPRAQARRGLLRGIQHPGRRADAANAGDAVEVAGDRHFRRARFNPRADRRRQGLRPAGPAAQDDPRIHDARLRHFGSYEGQRLEADEGVEDRSGGNRHRPRGAAHAGGYRPSLRRGRAGLRYDFRERAGGAAHGLSVPPRRPSFGIRHRNGRPVRTGAGLVHLRRGRPDEPLCRQRRRAEDADPVPDPLGDKHRAVRPCDRRGTAGDPRHRDQPRACPPRCRRRDPEHGGEDRPLRTQRLLPAPHHALRPEAVQGRLPGLACLARCEGRHLARRIPRGEEERI